MHQWFVVHTHAHGEELARTHLERQGFEVYLPRYRKQRRHARRTDWVATPLFPRYLFVGLDTAEKRWRTLRSTVGVSSLVCQGDQPIPVSDRIIDGIRAREDVTGFVAMLEKPSLRHGDKVRIVGGPLAETEAIFECRVDAQRVAVLLRLLGRETRVRVSANLVEQRD